MPILDRSYRRYEALAPLAQARFWPITRVALSQLARRHLVLLLLALAWIPLALRIVQVVLIARLPQVGAVLPVNARLFGDFLGVQAYFALFLSALVGAGLVSDDLRTGGILLYLSRSLSQRDYIIGKLGVLLALNLAVTLLPALLLYVAALGLAPAKFLSLKLAWLPLAIGAQAAAVTAVLSLLALGSSALSRRAWVAGLGLVTALMTLDLVAVTARHALDLGAAEILSPLGALRALAGTLFGAPDRAATDGLAALVVLSALSALALGVLRSRVRAVEIVR